jgi:hypothetical protein
MSESEEPNVQIQYHKSNPRKSIPKDPHPNPENPNPNRKTRILIRTLKNLDPEIRKDPTILENLSIHHP